MAARVAGWLVGWVVRCLGGKMSGWQGVMVAGWQGVWVAG